MHKRIPFKLICKYNILLAEKVHSDQCTLNDRELPNIFCICKKMLFFFHFPGVMAREQEGEIGQLGAMLPWERCGTQEG